MATNITFKQFQYFLEVAKTLNYSKAAEALFVSQSTLSKSIASLEQELGAILFFRDKHNVSLTPAGAVLATNLIRLKEDLGRTLDFVDEIKEGMRGRLSIGIENGMSLPESIISSAEYCVHSMPFLGLAITCMNREELSSCLDDGRIDVALLYRVDLEPTKDNHVVTSLGESPVCIAVSRGSYGEICGEAELNETESEKPVTSECVSEKKHDAAFNKKLLSKLQYGFVGDSHGPDARRWYDFCGTHGVYPSITAVKDVFTLRAMIEIGMLAAILPKEHQIFDSPNVMCVQSKDFYNLEVCMVSNAHSLNQIVEVFTKLVEAEI